MRLAKKVLLAIFRGVRWLVLNVGDTIASGIQFFN